MNKFPLSKHEKLKSVVPNGSSSTNSVEDFHPTSEKAEDLVKGFGGMVCEVNGELLEVQGCIERKLDIIETHEWKCDRKETSATKEYSFFHAEIGEIGKLKISTLPKGKTNLHSNFADNPNEEWLVKYLSNLVLLKPMSEPLQALLKVYSWQIEKKIFNTSTELYKLGFSNTPIDWGWERNGLEDFALRKQAEEEFNGWRNRIYELRKKDLNHILEIIVYQIRSDGLSLVMFDGMSREGKILQSMVSESLPTNSEKQIIKDTRIPVGKYDDLCKLWVNRPYIPRQTKDEFLSDNASELDKKSFDRILKDAHQREIISKDPGRNGRYKPKTVS